MTLGALALANGLVIDDAASSGEHARHMRIHERFVAGD